MQPRIRLIWTDVVPAILAAAAAVASTLAAPVAAAQSISIGPATLQPDLTATLAASKLAVGGGESIRYIVTISNPGVVAAREFLGPTLYFNTPADNVKFTLRLPVGTEWARIQSATGLQNSCHESNTHPECGGFRCAFNSPTLTCTGGHLGAEQSASFNVWTEALTVSGTYPSTLTVDPGQSIAERLETNNTASVSVLVQKPDLTVNLSPGAASVVDGGTLTYALALNNIGPSVKVDDVAVRLTIPPGATASAINAVGCGFVAPVLTCSGVDLAAADTSQTARRSINVQVTMPLANGPVSLTATIDPANAIAERTENNNGATVTTTVVGRPELSVSANDWFLTPLTLVRDVTVRNTGLASASGIEVVIDAFNDLTYDPVTRTFPHNLDVQFSWTAGAGFSCTTSPTATERPDFAEGERLRCTGGTLAAGASVTIEQVHLLGVGSHSGNRWTSAVVDPADVIDEQSETNNSAATD
jgi:hypothetical protein